MFSLLKNLSCKSLHAISVFKCKNEALKNHNFFHLRMLAQRHDSNLHLKSTSKCFKEVKIDKWTDLSYSFLP